MLRIGQAGAAYSQIGLGYEAFHVTGWSGTRDRSQVGAPLRKIFTVNAISDQGPVTLVVSENARVSPGLSWTLEWLNVSKRVPLPGADAKRQRDAECTTE